MRASGLGMLFVVAVLAGCGRSDPAEGPAQAGPPAPNLLSAPVDYLGATAAGKKAAEKTVSLAPVLSALQQFHAAEDRYPAQLHELVQAGFLARVPEAPPGQFLRYDPADGSVRWVARPGR